MVCAMTQLISLMFALGIPLGVTLAYHISMNMQPLPLWLIGVNLMLFALLGKDKFAAQNKGRRTPELTLLALTFAGGTPALFAGMQLFKHKRRKSEFTSALYAVIGAQLFLIWYFHQELWRLM